MKADPPARPKYPLPFWALNLTGFGILIVLVLVVFFWQMTTNDRDLQRNTLGRSQMISMIIEEHLANAELARNTIENVMVSVLRDKIRFIDYLNTIDPLQEDELTALAKETGLVGIEVVQQDGTRITGPADWQRSQPCTLSPDVVHYDQHGTALFVGTSDNKAVQCIQVGLDAKASIQLQAEMALPALLTNLSNLPGIRSVHLEEGLPPSAGGTIRLIDEHGKWTAETRLSMSSGTLVIALDASQHFNRIKLLRRQFFLFSALLLSLGLFFSWLLYHVQQNDLNRTRSFERLLAREHEAAALGRATAIIAHEVRNPLNAISMGLQRLRLESTSLDTAQHELVIAMQEAVNRTSVIINELQRFTQPLNPRLQIVDVPLLIQQLLILYQQRCQQQNIEITQTNTSVGLIEADPDLLAELLENLLKNSIEAQPTGGYIHIALNKTAAKACITLTNGNCTLSVDDAKRLGEPYFTTKMRGTGLGLALSRRIAEAHRGALEVTVDHSRQQFTALLVIPLVQTATLPS
ncbi:ATP-binding protein [Desulfobulbus oligotrophicus]|uniref:histidine kinase n=1 Tax=Desulfobulbus oligotrophicus TaxID=1909699 RepID=A0A7T5VFH1_9BACT|nr:ATP-binding protein [Desulfobulbus oligotrophicus]QQG66834.1 GHKL domain-containing protein [Desulfobulbus oligotrophicus]